MPGEISPGRTTTSAKVSMPAKEKEYADRIRRFIKAELKRAGISYKEFSRTADKAWFRGN
jgi:methionyl-tRNA synthetase